MRAHCVTLGYIHWFCSIGLWIFRCSCTATAASAQSCFASKHNLPYRHESGIIFSSRQQSIPTQLATASSRPLASRRSARGEKSAHDAFALSRLSATGSGNNEHSANEPIVFVPSDAQDLRLFVTQRCIQSFMYLLASTRDLHTVRWLDNFTQPVIVNNYWEDDGTSPNPGVGDAFRENDKRLGSKLLSYHGLSALNVTLYPEWDSFFNSLLDQPDTVLKIQTPKDVGRRAYTEFDIDIEPARLCSRILSVREQIAKEMTGDLKAITNMGKQIFDSYWHNAKNRRNTKQTKRSGSDNADSKPYGFDRPSLIFLEYDPRYDEALAPSPLRKGNFDLLYTLITQEAVVRLLEKGVVVGEDEVQNHACSVFLQNFYQERLLTHFVGAQWYGKGDDFIEELMLGSPIMMTRTNDKSNDDYYYEKGTNAEDSKISDAPPLVVEPLRIAEQVLLLRDKLSLEWMEIMQNVPSDHMDIRKLQLTRLMGQPKVIVADEFQ